MRHVQSCVRSAYGVFGQRQSQGPQSMGVEVVYKNLTQIL